MFLYPEHGQCDYIVAFNENSRCEVCTVVSYKSGYLSSDFFIVLDNYVIWLFLDNSYSNIIISLCYSLIGLLIT